MDINVTDWGALLSDVIVYAAGLLTAWLSGKFRKK